MVGQSIGKYRVLSRLGRGGMGTVYKAVDETLDREVAIKSLNPDLAESEVLKRFRAEALTLARLNHPNVATLYELTEHDGQLLMVMEFVRGETFEKLGDRLGAMSIPRAVELCGQALDALSHAHRAGVVHRDLKPVNLMLAESGLVKVMDFGLARMAGAEHLTNDGYMVGTPAYMSPEQVLGGEIDGRADLYAMGVVLYRLLCGHLPFRAESGIAMVQKQIHESPTPVRQFREELPRMCEDLFARALAKAPEDRFQTADEMKAALKLLSDTVSSEITRTMVSPVLRSRGDVAAGSVVNTFPSGAGPADSVPDAKRPPDRKPPLVAVVAGAVLLLAALPTGIQIWRGRPVDNPPFPAAEAKVVAPPEGSTSAPAAAPAAPLPAPPAKEKVREAPASDANAPSGAPAPPPVVTDREARPTIVFEKMKFLAVGDDGKSKDRDATLRLESAAMQVVDGADTLQAAAYDEVIGVFHSHSKEPRWSGDNGASVSLAKVGGGMFSFLKGTPDWITVRTRKGFIPLRVNDNDLPRVIAELEARTGTKIVRAK